MYMSNSFCLNITVGGASLKRITCQLSSEGGSLKSSQTRLKKRVSNRRQLVKEINLNQGKNIDKGAMLPFLYI